MKTTLFRLVLIGLCAAQLTACGFQLRGYNSTLTQNLPKTQLIFGNTFEDIAVKNALKQQFSQFSIQTQDIDIGQKSSSMPSIQVSNIKLQKYQLRGILTEIRMVMSADVTYTLPQSGAPKIVTTPIQVQRSYQYDQATVATDNPQADQIKVWLYDNLAQRITDQYMALNLPDNAATSKPATPLIKP